MKKAGWFLRGALHSFAATLIVVERLCHNLLPQERHEEVPDANRNTKHTEIGSSPR